MGINKATTALLHGSTDLETKSRIERLSQRSRRMTMSYILDASLKAHLPKLEAQVDEEQGTAKG